MFTKFQLLTPKTDGIEFCAYQIPTTYRRQQPLGTMAAQPAQPYATPLPGIFSLPTRREAAVAFIAVR